MDCSLVNLRTHVAPISHPTPKPSANIPNANAIVDI
jgi:hypothetical protein